MNNHPLNKFFKPESVAVIGASLREGSVGQAVFNNLVNSEYKGKIYPVNPKADTMLGLKTYSNVKKVPGQVDMAVVSTPAHTIPKIVAECGEKGIKAVLIISAGFKESGEKGEAMVVEIMDTAKKNNIRIIGPNCLGFIKPSLNFNASFAHISASPGKIAFISQSGALCTAILDWALSHRVGFSHFVSIGSMIDVGFHDLIDYFGEDPGTHSILIYMESLTHARKFLSAARAFSRTKPIIVLKSGKSSEGAEAAKSHTGTLAGNDRVFDAAFERAGIVRVNTIEELFNSAEALAKQKRPLGNRLTIVTNAGGPGVISTDFLVNEGGKLAEMSQGTLKKLNEVLPDAWSHGNPVDVLGDADASRIKKTLEYCLEEKNGDGILVIITPQAMTKTADIARDMVSVKNTSGKTLLACFMGEEIVREAREILQEGGIPNFRAPEDAVKCFMNMYSYSRNLELLYETPSTTPEEFTPRRLEAQELIDRKYSQNRLVLTEREAKELLSYYEIPVSEFRLATNEEEAGRIGDKLGFPVVMKISSPDILHKTDVGGIKLNIRSRQEAWAAYREIVSSARKSMPDAHIEGVFVEKMVAKKYELIIGGKKDPIFGPTIIFGMGGVAVEVFKDTNIGLPPLNMALAKRLIEDTKIYELLKGFRGMEGADLNAIEYLLYKFSYLLMDFREIKEIDINPFSVDKHGGVTLDAKVILDEDVKKGVKFKHYSHCVISPYPQEYITTFVMKDGREVILRPIRPEDEPMEAELFNNLSPEAQRFRFFGLIKNLTHDMLVRYTQIDYDREIAIVVEMEEKGKKLIAGVARLVEDAYHDSAEFAIVVADPWQGLGLGNKLTDYILEIAKRRQLKVVCATVLNDNYKMLGMFKKRGFDLKNRDEDTSSLEKRIDT
ncbi:MAG: bifunctional acetate--CoA ligase family protein/GNAT family N-acetyltransferase [Cyclobacteriaceae bacterium]|nr:bifunctional acetate--CoA ligase family protein/GNAT family N-acetyltransferase [Cyclobacteriaceae bacterium]